MGDAADFENVLAGFKVATSRNRIIAMNDATDDRDLDQADTQILIPEFPDEVLEVAAGIGGTIPTGSVNLIPPNCC
jgi:hypothetical protein